jgi:hypothetical protein
MTLNVEHLLRTADTLEQALLALQGCADTYGVQFADQTLTLLPAYVQDVRLLATKLQEVFDAAA